MEGSSNVYAPYQVLGLVNDAASTGCLSTIHRQGLSSFITTPVDDARALHLYDINLQLKGVTKPMPPSWITASETSNISRIAAHNEVTCAALGSHIGVFYRFRPFGLWHGHKAPIISLGMVDNVLVSISNDGNLISWVLPSSAKDPPSVEGEIATNIRLPIDYEITCFAHPQSYKNKILLGTGTGRCILLNLRTGKIVHIFEGFGSSITTLEPAPVFDVVAVGTLNGEIHLHNFLVDETIATLRHSTDKAESDDAFDAPKATGVHSITFRSDADESMVTADNDGNLYVWDLNEKSLRCDVRHAHGPGPMLAKFLPGEPILVSAGIGDNSVKVHIFDHSNGHPRLLRARDGHSLPPTFVRFCGYDGFSMVSAGLDRELRFVSAVNESRNRSFAQDVRGQSGNAKKRRRVSYVDENEYLMSKKLPPVITLVSCNRRERDGEYGNIVTIHEGMQEAYTWRLRHGAQHKHILKPPMKPERYELIFQRQEPNHQKPGKKSNRIVEQPRMFCATSAAITPCGTFAVVGMGDGRVHSYNLQSGRHIGAYSDQDGSDNMSTDENTRKSTWGYAHSCSVAGLAIDACGDSFLSAGSQDRILKFWDTHSRELQPDIVKLTSDITHVQWCGVSDLIAVACEDFVVYIYDAATRKLARKFVGHCSPLADICFDPLGRRLVSAALDSTIKVWDLPSGSLVDTMTCTDTPTSIAMAPSGDYLASTHVNSLSVRMWVDKSKFGPILSKGSAESATTEFEKDESENDSHSSGENTPRPNSSQHVIAEKNQEEEVFPLMKGIITLSGRPTSQWTTLSNLDEFRERNKPTKPAEKPESAPFFLPTKKGLKFEFEISDETKSKDKIKRSSSDIDDELPPSNFGKLIIADRFDDAAKFMRRLDPSGADVEIRTVGGPTARRKAVEYFQQRLQSLADYELCHAHLSVFLKAHGVALTKDPSGLDLTSKLLEAHESSWEKLRSSMDAVSCLSAYFSGQV